MKKFSITKTGYDTDEVNAFVAEVAKNYEDMLNSLKDRDQKIQTISDKLKYYEGMESTLNRALLVAEDASNQIKRVAREESNLLLDDAKKNANRIINSALMKAEKAENDAEALRRKVNVYKRRIRQVIEEQLEFIDEIEEVDM